MRGTPKLCFLMIFISRNTFLPENQNGPYGPYEQLVKDGKGNYWQKKKELGTKSQILEGSKISKISFDVQNWSFEVNIKDRTTLKNILTPKAIKLTKFPIKFILFLMNFMFFC